MVIKTEKNAFLELIASILKQDNYSLSEYLHDCTPCSTLYRAQTDQRFEPQIEPGYTNDLEESTDSRLCVGGRRVNLIKQLM